MLYMINEIVGKVKRQNWIGKVLKFTWILIYICIKQRYTNGWRIKIMKNKREVLVKLFLSTLYLSAFTFGGGYVIVTLMKKKFVDD